MVELLAPRAQAKGLEIASYVDERLPAQCRRRRRAAAPGAAQSRRQRHQVHRSRRRRRRGRAGRLADEISFEVRDTGIGIAPERTGAHLPRVRAGRRRRRPQVRRHRPRACDFPAHRRAHGRHASSVESAPGAGATFRVALPLPRPRTQRAPASPRPTSPAAVLIVAPHVDRGGADGAAADALGRAQRDAPTTIARRRSAGARMGCVLVDHALGATTRSTAAAADRRDVARRIVLITPGERARTRRAQGGRLHRLSGQAGARRLAGGAARTASDAFDAHAADRADAAASRRAGTARHGLSILVAEDNEINALLARALLAKLGHRPTVRQRAAPLRSQPGRGACGRHALRSGADGRADAGHRRARGHAAHPRCRSGSRERRARRSSRSPPMPSPRIATPASPPAWTRFWSSRSTASGWLLRLHACSRAVLACGLSSSTLSSILSDCHQTVPGHAVGQALRGNCHKTVPGCSMRTHSRVD